MSEVAKFREAADSAATFDAESRARRARREDGSGRGPACSYDSAVAAGGRHRHSPHPGTGRPILARGLSCASWPTWAVSGGSRRPGKRLLLIRAEEEVTPQAESLPDADFPGVLKRPGTHVREDEKDRFVVAEVQVESPPGLLKQECRARRRSRQSEFRSPSRSSGSRLGISGTSSGHFSLELYGPAPETPCGDPPGGRGQGARRTPRPSADRPALRKDLARLAASPDGRSDLDRQEPRNDQILSIQELAMGDSPALRRTRTTSQILRKSTAIPPAPPPWSSYWSTRSISGRRD